MRKLPVKTHGIPLRGVQRVISLALLANEWESGLQFMVLVDSIGDAGILEQLVDGGLKNIVVCVPYHLDWHSHIMPTVACDTRALELHDVVVLNLEKQELLVVYRNSDMHHAIQLTNRCNSFCLMCSQPPTTHDDQWLIDEALLVAAHINDSPSAIGLSGGEPLLLGPRLREVIDAYATRLPSTRIEILTNGRLLADEVLATHLLTGISDKVSWLVPLYGHADFLHDFVVQSVGAFEQTIGGLLTLQSYGQAIQLRIVLIEPTLRVLPELCRFIGRNLPFVREVALMGCEPIGFALANRDACKTDLADWHAELIEAANALRRANVPYIFMNTPLCALPQSLWAHAHQSISDWKRSFREECSICVVKTNCSGLFSWHNHNWTPTVIKAIDGKACNEEVH
ncbi:MAG: His-Xaa-Ser system radical SAM maturase HxsC [Gallionella sp.]|nr:His-Xaa-Ser system radical SAM maturase HxsC [Gallionella sp.]MCK9355076.1 His-Xaa-Ser system radical SAM maturase HxsC [Gallionella sp.]